VTPQCLGMLAMKPMTCCHYLCLHGHNYNVHLILTFWIGKKGLILRSGLSHHLWTAWHEEAMLRAELTTALPADKG
jgi:hypothetical protein